MESFLVSSYHRTLSSQLREFETQRLSALPAVSAQGRECGFLHRWHLAFEGFLVGTETSFDLGQRTQAVLLDIQRLTGTITVNAGPYAVETIFDSFEYAFSRIVKLASSIVAKLDGDGSHGGGARFPSFDMGILPPLYYVASRCRHPVIRRQALDLLRRGPIQEGVWHRAILASIAEYIMKLEETECPGAKTSADIAGSSRVSVLNARMMPAECLISLHCCQRLSTESGSTYIIHEMIAY